MRNFIATAVMAGTALGGAPAFGQQTVPGAAVAPQIASAETPDAPSLLAGFQTPPDQARARTWWHWINGNVTEAGIVADLEWMKRAGIGGAHYFDAGGPIANFSYIRPRIVVGDRNWASAVRLAAKTADRLGLELTTAASSGWSETGGPWVTPAQAQKKYVWSETVLKGGRRFNGRLAEPPRTTGGFQNGPRTGNLGEMSAGSGPTFYADAMVVAYRMAKNAGPDPVPVRVTSTSGELDVARLGDGDIAAGQSVTSLPKAPTMYVQAEFARPVTVRGVSIGIEGEAVEDPATVIEASDDGRSWRAVATLHGPANALLKTYGFTPVTARFVRIVLPAKKILPVFMTLMGPVPTPEKVTLKVTELTFHAEATVDRFVEKSGFSEPVAWDEIPNAASTDSAIAPRNVVDLTGRMAPDGTLDWTPPSGTWRVIRLGYSLTGTQNGPAPAEATGLEVDKFSPAHVRSYLSTYLNRFQGALGADLMGRRGLRNLLSDSWEAGVQNWTDNMPAEFKARRGYELAPWLPVLTGRIVESPEASDRFLWDWRRTLQDLLAQHYQIIRDELGRRGMGFYAEAQGDTWRAIADGMEIKSRSDIPMAEYWYRTYAAGPGQPSLKADMKESASVANLYGRPFVANESLTVFGGATPWSYAPSSLKPVIDEIFAYGVNRFVLHTSVHQPDDRKPGLGLGPFGQYINRHETWAEQARPFFDYIARASWLLQQGHTVADVAYFYGEERPVVALFKSPTGYDAANDRLAIEVPQGTDYDFINAETLRTATRVEGGVLKSTGGAAYRVLFLRPDVEAMTLETLTRIDELVRSGMILVGHRPKRSLGRAGDDGRFARLAAGLWGDGGGDTVRSVGRGRVYAGGDLAAALAAEKVAPDVLATNGGATLLHLHRRISANEDIYYLVNRAGTTLNTEASFRAAEGVPMLWHADDGRVEPLSYRREGGRTIVPLTMQARDSAFVVFRPGPSQPALSVPAKPRLDLVRLDGPWKVGFQKDRGAPSQVTMRTLGSWSESAEPGVRYFSGTATYRQRISVPASVRRADGRVLLDLGDVKEVASVRINGRDAGTVWKSPYVVDVTQAVRVGANDVEVAVSNLWANRLIGDAAAKPDERRYTFTARDLPDARKNPIASMGWSAKAQPLPSGLLGPVVLKVEEAQ